MSIGPILLPPMFTWRALSRATAITEASDVLCSTLVIRSAKVSRNSGSDSASPLISSERTFVSDCSALPVATKANALEPRGDSRARTEASIFCSASHACEPASVANPPTAFVPTRAATAAAIVAGSTIGLQEISPLEWILRDSGEKLAVVVKEDSPIFGHILAKERITTVEDRIVGNGATWPGLDPSCASGPANDQPLATCRDGSLLRALVCSGHAVWVAFAGPAIDEVYVGSSK
jgi:hypothetical protein